MDDAPADLVAVAAEFDESVVETVDVTTIPAWDATPPRSSVLFATRWARERRSVVLGVPSVMIPSERNFVINPEHPRITSSVHVLKAQPFEFDRRLMRRRA